MIYDRDLFPLNINRLFYLCKYDRWVHSILIFTLASGSSLHRGHLEKKGNKAITPFNFTHITAPKKNECGI